MSGLFGSDPPPTPKPTPAPPMPDYGNPAVKEAKRNFTEELATRAGRASTIMTTAESRGDGKGGDNYATGKLGN